MIVCSIVQPDPCRDEPTSVLLLGTRQYRSTVIAWAGFPRCTCHSTDWHIEAMRAAFPERIFVIVPIVYGKLKIITPAERTSNEASNPHHSHVPRADR